MRRLPVAGLYPGNCLRRVCNYCRTREEVSCPVSIEFPHVEYHSLELQRRMVDDMRRQRDEEADGRAALQQQLAEMTARMRDARAALQQQLAETTARMRAIVAVVDDDDDARKRKRECKRECKRKCAVGAAGAVGVAKQVREDTDVGTATCDNDDVGFGVGFGIAGHGIGI